MATGYAFLPKTTTKTIAASSTSASATWSSTDSDGDCIRIFNANTEAAFVRFGRGAQTAVLTDLPIAPGSVEVIGCANGIDTIAVILAGAGTSNVYATKGEGV